MLPCGVRTFLELEMNRARDHLLSSRSLAHPWAWVPIFFFWREAEGLALGGNGVGLDMGYSRAVFQKALDEHLREGA